MPLSDYMSDCVFMERKIASHPAGGDITKWIEGEPFRAAISNKQNMEARIAQSQGVTATFTIVVDKNTPIGFQTIFQCLSGDYAGIYFRITNYGISTPEKARVQNRQFAAESMRELPE